MKRKVIFIGSKSGGLRVLERILAIAPESIQSIITLPDQEDQRSRLKEISKLAEGHGIELLLIRNHNDLGQLISKRLPRFCLVFGWYRILSPELLDLVPGGFFGIHPSLLPKYRGAAPLVWAVINGDSESGVSLFKFDKGIDDGDIVGQRKFPIAADDTIAQVWAKAESQAAGLIDDHYLKLLSGKAAMIRQDHNQASYCSARQPVDGEINWRLDSEAIHNFIRGQSYPYPGAFSLTDKGIKITIQKAELFEFKFYGVPGLAAQTDNGGVLVGCGRGALRVLEVNVDDGPVQEAPKVLKYGVRFRNPS